MYKEFFQLRENPFNVTADSSFFFASASHSEAFSHLTFGIEHRKGIIVITGEIGTGKTTLCRTLLNGLSKQIKTALILNPKFSDQELLKIIVQDLGIIDHFESIRLLSNIETEKEKLLQIVLIGQPELQEKLQLPELRQLNQRISVRYHIEALDKNETREYIVHRLKLAAADKSIGPKVEFTNSAMKAIYKSTLGKPRMINILCDRAMLYTFINSNRVVDDQTIK